jgi:ribosomal protein L11 methylase PrmA
MNNEDINRVIEAVELNNDDSAYEKLCKGLMDYDIDLVEYLKRYEHHHKYREWCKGFKKGGNYNDEISELNYLGKSAPLEARREFIADEEFIDKLGYYKTTCWQAHTHMRIVYVRVDDLIFLDDKLKNKIPSDLHEQIIYLSNFDSALRLQTDHTGLGVYALKNIDLENKIVLDLGCGDGVLGLAANYYGAKKVIGIDIEKDDKKKMNKHLEANNLDESIMDFVNVNIRKKNLLLSKIPVEEVDVVVSNIGPEYGRLDYACVSLLDGLPNAESFIGGGYAEGDRPPEWSHNAENIMKKLESRGYNSHQRMTVNSLNKEDFGYDLLDKIKVYTPLTFISKKV